MARRDADEHGRPLKAVDAGRGRDGARPLGDPPASAKADAVACLKQCGIFENLGQLAIGFPACSGKQARAMV
jgi:hypothetical protein